MKRLDEIVGMRCTTNFVSDSSNGMMAVRPTLLKKIVKWEYG